MSPKYTMLNVFVFQQTIKVFQIEAFQFDFFAYHKNDAPYQQSFLSFFIIITTLSYLVGTQEY